MSLALIERFIEISNNEFPDMTRWLAAIICSERMSVKQKIEEIADNLRYITDFGEYG
jgi:hypothetical protein